MIDGEIRVEVESTNPPRPTGFAVLVNGKTVAVLTIDKVQTALARYTALESARASARVRSAT